MSSKKNDRDEDDRYNEVLGKYEVALEDYEKRVDGDQLKNLLIAALIAAVILLGAALAFVTHSQHNGPASPAVTINVSQHQNESQSATSSAWFNCPKPVNPPTPKPVPTPKPKPPCPKPRNEV